MAGEIRDVSEKEGGVCVCVCEREGEGGKKKGESNVEKYLLPRAINVILNLHFISETFGSYLFFAIIY